MIKPVIFGSIMPRKALTNTVKLQLSLPSPFASGQYPGSGGALSRIFDKVMESSRPVEKFSILFLQTPENQLPVKIVGALLYSEGNRIIFYPALTQRFVLATPNKRTGKALGRIVHHITVEQNLENWHVTTMDNHHETIARTTKVEERVLHLFSMCVSGTEKLETAPETMTVTMKTTENDMALRTKRLADATTALEHHLITLDKQLDGFLNFDFFLDTRLEREHNAFPLNFPVEADTHSVEPPEPEDICKNHDVTLPRLSGTLVVRAAWLRGKLKKHDGLFYASSK